MENNKFWVYLGLGVVAALSLKWFMAPESTTVSNRWSIQANMGDEIQYKRSAKSNDRVAGLSGARRSTPVLNQIKSGATTAAPKAAAKKEDVKAKNVAKKKDDKKKKRKKKLKLLPVPESDVTSDDSDENIAQVPTSSGAVAPNAFAAGQAGPSQTEAELTDWEKLLLVTPNHRETTRFISLFQSKQVKAEVFYGIIGQMLNDGRTQMRSLGVMALGATPSVRSYEMLIATSEIESGPVKTQANSYLGRTYSRPQAVNYLYGALVKPEANTSVQLQGLKNLEALLGKVRQTASIETQTGEVEAPAAQSAISPDVIRYFSLLQSNVIPLLKQSPDQEVRNLAETVSSQLAAAVNAAGVRPVQTAATN